MAKNIFDYEENIQNVPKQTQKNIEDMVEHYKGYSQDELMQELFSVASKEKQNGTLSKEKLDSIKSTLAPYLNASQIEFLEKLIEKLNV